MMPEWDHPSSDPVLADGQVHIWFCDFRTIQDFGRSLSYLSEDERARAARFKTEESKLTFTGSHIFLRRVLAGYLKSDPAHILFQAESHGKPCLSNAESPLQFNLSHAKQAAICAVAHGFKVGIDLEPVNPQLCEDSIAEQVFSEAELACLRRMDSSERTAAFFRGWTRKEAYAKCVGLGMSADLKKVELALGAEIARYSGIGVQTFRCPNRYIASLAVGGTPSAIKFFDWPPAGLISPAL